MEIGVSLEEQIQNPKSKIQNRTALITGASEGIGLELARIMAADGWSLVLVARREELLNKLAEELRGLTTSPTPPSIEGGDESPSEANPKSPPSIVVLVLPADLSRPNAAAEIVRQLEKRGVQIDALVNNAGFGLYGEFAGQELERLEQMVEVNISSLVRLTRLFLPGMVERGQGMVMNVASLAGFQPIPTRAVYAATKAFVISFSEALAVELAGTGVTVTCLCPGYTATGFKRVASMGGEGEYPKGTMTAAAVARTGYKAMIDRKRVVVTGGMNKFLSVGTKLVPRRISTVVAGWMAKKQKIWRL